MTTLPSDLDVARQLSFVRASVIEATQHVRSPKRSTRYRTTRNLIIAGAAIAALTGGGIIVFRAAQETIDTTVECYHEPTLDSVPVGVAGDPISVQDPLGLCGLLWRNDLFDPANNNDPDPNDGTLPVPPLVACVLDNGVTAVFPLEGASEEGFCEAIGLADWGSD
ncbi:MAG: hypothetical protein ABIQ01_11740 [Pseudolysinimonas sp.]